MTSCLSHIPRTPLDQTTALSFRGPPTPHSAECDADCRAEESSVGPREAGRGSPRHRRGGESAGQGQSGVTRHATSKRKVDSSSRTGFVVRQGAARALLGMTDWRGQGRFSSRVLPNPHPAIDFLREAPRLTRCCAKAWRRPKDLASGANRLNLSAGSGPVVPESRSFGRAQAVVSLLGSRGALPQEVTLRCGFEGSATPSQEVRARWDEDNEQSFMIPQAIPSSAR
jgi:hypothetical protein